MLVKLVASVHLLAAVFIITLIFPLLRSTIPRNKWYGIKFKKALESEENWQKINKYGAQRIFLWAWVLGFIAILFSIFEPPDNLHTLIALGVMPLILVVPVVEAYLFAKKL